MKIPKHDQWILDYRDDPEAIERRIESLVDRRRMVRILVWTWTVIATVLAVLSVVVAGGEPKFMAVGAYCLGMAAILFAGRASVFGRNQNAGTAVFGVLGG